MASKFRDGVRNAAILLFVVLCASDRALTPTDDRYYPRARTPSVEGCTIGVASARATADGRPLLWKVRDNADMPSNSISYDTSYPHHYVAVTNSGDQETWMGVNERGFAIINSTSSDLPGGTSGLSNGLLMRHALGTCARVEEFELLLDSTNITGRLTQGNFGVIDAGGAAAIYEVGGNAYWRFDANDTIESSEGYILRTNFSRTGGGNAGIERYRRAVSQIGEFHVGDSLDYRRIIRYHARDFSDFNSSPISIPYTHEWTSTSPLGYFYSNSSVCRFKTVSVAAIVGVKPGEMPTLSTMWTVLGHPATGIAVPYWPVGVPPEAASGTVTSPLNAIASEIRSLLFDFTTNTDYIDSYKLRDECGNGLWAVTYPAEDSIFNAASRLLGEWRREIPPTRSMLQAEITFASYAHSELTYAHDRLVRRKSFTVANVVPFEDEGGKTLENGDVVQLIWAGEDGAIDPPNAENGSPDWGQPGGDDRLVGIPHAIGENVLSEGTFRLQLIAWPDRRTGCPANGDLVYLRAFNSTSLKTATRYGDAQIHPVSMSDDNAYVPLIKGARTTQPLGGSPAAEIPRAHFNLSPNFPNPFNSTTVIEFDVPYGQESQGLVELIIFNSLGQSVRSLYSGTSTGGRKRLEWDGRDERGIVQPSGVYFVRLKAGSIAETGRMLLIK
jgi:hypothetical protein